MIAAGSVRVCVHAIAFVAGCVCARQAAVRAGVECGSVCVHAAVSVLRHARVCVRALSAESACVRAAVERVPCAIVRRSSWARVRVRNAVTRPWREGPRRVSLRKKTEARDGDVRRGYHEKEDGGRVRARGHHVRRGVRALDRGAAIVSRPST